MVHFPANKDYYLGLIRECKLPHLWANSSWILHHNNASLHKTVIVQELLATSSSNIIYQATYSPDLFSIALLMFLKHQLPPRKIPFQTIECHKNKFAEGTQDDYDNGP